MYANWRVAGRDTANGADVEGISGKENLGEPISKGASSFVPEQSRAGRLPRKKSRVKGLAPISPSASV